MGHNFRQPWRPLFKFFTLIGCISSRPGHRNVYVAVHMPHSHSKHRSHNRHHKRKHGRHGNGRGHHSNGHNRDDDADGNGFVEHDVSVEQNSEEVAPSVASSGGEAQVKPRVPRISLDMTTHPVEREELLEGHPRFGKSHSLPSGHYAMMPDAAHFAKMGELSHLVRNPFLPCLHSISTPSTPCSCFPPRSSPLLFLSLLLLHFLSSTLMSSLPLTCFFYSSPQNPPHPRTHVTESSSFWEGLMSQQTTSATSLTACSLSWRN